MKTRARPTFMKALLFVLLSLAVTISAYAYSSDSNTTESETMDQWQKYEDSDYGFTFEYPADWEVMTLIEQPQPYPEPEKIVRKYAFTGAEGYVTLSVFLTQGFELPVWLENQNKTSPDLFPVMETNSRVAGYPSVAFVTDENLIVFMSNGEYVYRFWHPLTDSKPALQANWHILDTFRTLEENVADTGTFIPQSVVDEVQDVLEAAQNLDNQINSCTSVQGQGCCSDAPALQACYRFPCSVSNGAHKGNCTYYVCYRYGGVPFSGSAGTWWSQVPTTPGWYRYSSPPNGTSIAWWSGHVAYIHSYWGGGMPTFQEQSWCGTCTQTRQNWAQGYIQKGPPPAMAPPAGQ